MDTKMTLFFCSLCFFTGTLPSPKETIKGNIKTVTEYKIDDDGRKCKVKILFTTKKCKLNF